MFWRWDNPQRGVGGGGGGGHFLFEGNYPLPNYRPCFSGLSSPEFSLTAPYFWEFEPPPSKIKLFQCKILHKDDSNFVMT